MRQYQGQYITIARIFLFLSIVRFVLAAPVVVREVHGMHVNVVGVAEDGAATSQKRWDDWLANVADHTRAPTTPRQPDSDRSGLHSPRSSTNNAPSSGSSGSALSTGPHPRPRADSPPRLPDHPAPHVNYVSSSSTSTGTGNDLPTSPTLPLMNDEPSTASSSTNEPPETKDISSQLRLVGSKSRPAGPETELSLGPSHPAGPEAELILRPSHPAGPGAELSLGPSHPVHPEMDLPGPGSSHPVHPEPEVQPETSHSGLGSGPSHLAEPEMTKNFLDQMGSESAGPSHVADLKLETKEVLGLFLKGKFKRRISGSGAVNSAGYSDLIFLRN